MLYMITVCKIGEHGIHTSYMFGLWTSGIWEPSSIIFGSSLTWCVCRA